MKNNKTTLWGGRFNQKSNQLFQNFNNSLHIDYRLAKYDIQSSIAWSKALKQCYVLTKQEQIKIQNALNILLNQIHQNPKNILDSNEEDIHSWVESKLVGMLGTLAKKLNTGRSRNDQVTTDLKLWCKDIIIKLLNYLIKLQHTLLITAEKTINDIMPGYTHLQRAQPITFAYWCLAYIEMFIRDENRLQETLKRIDISPLGSGALCGTTWLIDRKKLALRLGFSKITKNSLDAVSDRDYVIELLSNASISMMHLSRFSEDLIFFNSGESNFIELSDAITSGSSLMPQKKNPDALELIRGKSSRVYGYLISMLVLLKGLPLSYNKDMQEDKENLFYGLDIWKNCLKISILVLQSIKIKHDICSESAKKGYSNATELADYLVKKGMSFRTSHHISGQIVLKAMKYNCPLENLSLSMLRNYSIFFDKDIYDKLSLHSCINSRNSQGGVSFSEVLKSINRIKKNKFYI
ncbi:argininosuccinate lyase [Buchnera aphidicola]|uniref:Argininosuccinate lyase n=1 Tax=Buchnera aphidicola (Stegophylla sp.) TaxID=2315800 RepID=A0A4D6YA14_9GAMM|nr:argininosuccinate lyase [Buchnera aphidicola (Stegophylla sp.)]QCI26239.1 argininosuccinate lyase [Buchnera aphidicola (Stegophylla sp.)]